MQWMNNHLERLKQDASEQRGKSKIKNKKMFRGIILCAAFLFGIQEFHSMTRDAQVDDGEQGSITTNVQDENESQNPHAQEHWNLILVNGETPLSLDFRVVLEDVGAHKVDSRIVDSLQQMIDAAELDGVTIGINSAYRSVAEQTTLYEGRVQEFRNQGYSEAASIERTKQYCQPPGLSEHHTGLAVDLKSTSYQWLAEHGPSYGFVQRFEAHKTQYTAIAEEPWHYRYVGVDVAQEMTEQDICLEEYLEITNNELTAQI